MAAKKAKTENLRKEQPLRSIMKTISWRVIATGTTFLLTMLFFRDDPNATEKATGVAIAEATIKMLFYYLHERAWTNITWGTEWKRRKRFRKIKKERRERDKKLFHRHA